MTITDIGAICITWWKRNFSMKHGRDDLEKGYFAHPLHLLSPSLSSSLLPLANVISFGFTEWVQTKCKPTAKFFPLGETEELELGFQCWYLYCAVFVSYFYVTYGSASSNTFTSPAHPPAVHHYQLLACLPSLYHRWVCEDCFLLPPH